MEHRDREKRKRFDPKNRRYYETRTKLWKHQLNVLKYSNRAEQPEWVALSTPDVMQIQSSNGEETGFHDQGRDHRSGDVERVDHRAKRSEKSTGGHRASSRTGGVVQSAPDVMQTEPSNGEETGFHDQDRANSSGGDVKKVDHGAKRAEKHNGEHCASSRRDEREVKRENWLASQSRRAEDPVGKRIGELDSTKQEVDDSKQSFRPPRSDGRKGTRVRSSRQGNSSELKLGAVDQRRSHRRRNSFSEGSRIPELDDAKQAVDDSKQSFRPPRSDGRQGTGLRDSRQGTSSALKLREADQRRPHRRRNSFSEGSRIRELLVDDAKQEVDDSKQGFRPPRSDGRKGTGIRSSSPGSSSALKLREEGQNHPHRRRNSFSEGSRDGAGLLKSPSNWEIQRQSSGVWRPEDSRSSKGSDGFGVCQSLMENLSLAAKLRDAPVDKLEDVKTEAIERTLFNEFRGSNKMRNLTHGKRKDQGRPTLIELQSSSLHTRKKTSRLSESIASSKLYLATSKDQGKERLSSSLHSRKETSRLSESIAASKLYLATSKDLGKPTLNARLSSSLHSRRETSRLSESIAASKLYLATSKLLSARSDVTTRTEDSTTASSCTDDLESVAPEYRARAASKLHTLTNKDIDYANRFSVVPGSPLHVRSTLGSSGRIGKSPRATAR